MTESIEMADIVRELHYAARHRNSNHLAALADTLEAWANLTPAAYRTCPELMRHVNRTKDMLDAEYPYGDAGHLGKHFG